MGQASLIGVQNDEYRKVLHELQRQGWNINTENNGHLRLTHEHVSIPVQVSKTPSDIRAPYNLRAKCRRLIASDSPDAPGHKGHSSTSSTQNYEEIMRKRKKDEKRRKRRQHMPEHRLGSAKPHHCNTSETTPGDQDAPHLPTEKEDVKMPENVMADTARKPANTQPALEARLEGANTTAASALSAPVSSLGDLADDDGTAQGAPAEAPAKARTEKVNVNAPKKKATSNRSSKTDPEEIARVPQDVLELAMRIANGEGRRIDITADMIGSQLYLLDDDVFLLEGGKPASTQPCSSNKKAKASASEHQTPSMNKRVNKRVLEILHLMHEPMSQSDIYDLIDGEFPETSRKIIITTISKSLRFNIANGKVRQAGDRYDPGRGTVKTYVLTS